MIVRCPKCNIENSIIMDLGKTARGMMNARGYIDWIEEESKLTGYPFCLECNWQGTVEELEQYNSYCECGGDKLPEMNFCKDCI